MIGHSFHESAFVPSRFWENEKARRPVDDNPVGFVSNSHSIADSSCLELHSNPGVRVIELYDLCVSSPTLLDVQTICDLCPIK
jgi:hypothetical protein